MERSDSLKRAFRRALPIVLLAVGALTPQPARAEAAIESQVTSKIRAYRGAGLVVHSGLLAAARNHSRGMATRGGLDHNDADARVQNASPDPVEGNGAPDDGFGVAAWCENVTYVMSHPEHEVAERVFNAWEGSGAHGRCMKEKHRNVGAVGIYYDGQSWWATFIAQVDNTPPGGAPPAPPKQEEEPAPVAKPAASAPPAAEPAQQPAGGQRSEPAGLLDDTANEPAANNSGNGAAESETAPSERSADEAERSEPAAAANILRRPESRQRAQAIPRAPSSAALTYGWQ